MNKGFSLVELIVVIAIMAILVGVAVPVYTSYIGKANDATDIQAIDNLNHACQIVSAEYSVAVTYSEGTDDKGNSIVTATLTKKAAADQLAAILGINATEVKDGETVTGYAFTITLKNNPVDQGATPVEGKAQVPSNITISAN